MAEAKEMRQLLGELERQTRDIIEKMQGARGPAYRVAACVTPALLRHWDSVQAFQGLIMTIKPASRSLEL